MGTAARKSAEFRESPEEAAKSFLNDLKKLDLFDCSAEIKLRALEDFVSDPENFAGSSQNEIVRFERVLQENAPKLFEFSRGEFIDRVRHVILMCMEKLICQSQFVSRAGSRSVSRAGSRSVSRAASRSVSRGGSRSVSRASSRYVKWLSNQR